MKRRLLLAAIVLVLLLIGGLVIRSYVARRNAYVYSGVIETREIQIGSKIGGRVTAVHVEESQTVNAGAALVSFECDELKAQRAEAEARVQEAQADLDRMQRGNRPEEIAQADATAQQQRAMLDAARSGPRPQELNQATADYAAAKADAVNAQSTFQRMEKLVRDDTISRQQFDDARGRRDATAQKEESVRQRLALLQAGTRAEDLQAADQRYRQAAAAAALAHRGFRREDIDAARGRLAEVRATVDQLDVRLNEAELAAPATGVIQTVSIRPGDLVPAGRIVVSMLESSQLWVKIYVPETDLAGVRFGQPASVEVDSFSGRRFSGHVQQISSQAEFLPRNVQARDDREHQVFAVKIGVDNPEGALKSGMSATVRLLDQVPR